MESLTRGRSGVNVACPVEAEPGPEAGSARVSLLAEDHAKDQATRPRSATPVIVLVSMLLLDLFQPSNVY